MLNVAFFFYKNLFVEGPSTGVHLGENFWKQSDKRLGKLLLVHKRLGKLFLVVIQKGPRPGWTAFLILSKVLEGNWRRHNTFV